MACTKDCTSLLSDSLTVWLFLTSISNCTFR